MATIFLLLKSTTSKNNKLIAFLEMKSLKYFIFTLLFILLNTVDIFCQPGPPGGTGMGGPPCWPPSTCETPINNELIFLLIAGLSLSFYFFKKKNLVT